MVSIVLVDEMKWISSVSGIVTLVLVEVEEVMVHGHRYLLPLPPLRTRGCSCIDDRLALLPRQIALLRRVAEAVVSSVGLLNF